VRRKKEEELFLKDRFQLFIYLLDSFLYFLFFLLYFWKLIIKRTFFIVRKTTPEHKLRIFFLTLTNSTSYKSFIL